jgi:cupin 2 domain-containing protein
MTFNLFTNLPSDLPDEFSTTLLEASNLRIERIVSHSHASPEGFWYDQDDHEWVVVLQGAARLQLEDRTIDLGPGARPVHDDTSRNHAVVHVLGLWGSVRRVGVARLQPIRMDDP